MNRWLKYIAWLSLVAIAATAVCALVGWLTHDLTLIQIRPQYALMQFNTAVCMLLTTMAVAALLHGDRQSTTITASLVLVISFLTTLEYVTGTGFGIDTLFITPFTNIYTPMLGRMGLNVALAFLLASVATLQCNNRRLASRQAMLVALASSLIFALGAVPLLGYFSGIVEAYRWGLFTRMSLPSAGGFVLLAPILTLYAGIRTQTLHRWLPSTVFLALATISLASAVAVRVHERQEIQESLQQQVDEMAANYTGHLHDLYTALNRIAMRWEAAGGTPHDLWVSDVASYIHDLPFLAGMSWTDKDSTIRWLVPMAGNEHLIGRQLGTDPYRGPTMAEAETAHEARVTPTLELYSHGTGYLYIRPLYPHGKYDGMLIAGIRLDPMLKAMSDRKHPDFSYALRQDDRIVVSNFTDDPELQQWEVSAPIQNLNHEYQLIIRPDAAYIASHRSFVPAAVFGTGTLMAALVGLSVGLMLRARRHSRRSAEAEQFVRTILSSASYLIIATDTEGKILLFNAEAERALGWKAEEVIGLTPALWHDEGEVALQLDQLRRSTGRDDLNPMDAFQIDALYHGRSEGDWSIMRRDGTCFPGRLTVTPRYDTGGALLGFLGIIKDMSEQKRQEALLRTSEETFRLAMEYSPIGMALVAPHGRWLKVNQAICDMTGYTREELLSIDFQAVTHPDDLRADLDLLQQLIAGEIKYYTMEKRYFRKDGGEIKVLLSVSMVKNDDSTVKYFVAMIQDITEREKLIGQLQQANSELEQFAYVASHDLQEPLRMVTNFVGLIGSQYEDKLDARGKEFVSIAVSSAKRMQKLISDLLEYARLGRDSQLCVLIDSNDEMKHVVQNLDALITATGAKVEVGQLPDILGNPVEFLRLMQNLIGNGIKFQRPGVTPHIRVSALREGDEFIFSIADNGIGVKPEYAERIFQPFKRLHTQQEYQGSGIGLAVCRKIVNNFGGRIWIESVPGEGATIRFSVPVPEEKP